MFGIKGKVVLVTGASSGIGRPQRAISPKSGPAWSWRHMRIMSSLSGRAAASAVLLSVGALGGEGVPQAWTKEKCMQDVVGLWVNPDGHIRLELLPDGRYDEARGARRSAYTGRWELDGSEIRFLDDFGFTASGTLSGGTLTAGPDTFRRVR